MSFDDDREQNFPAARKGGNSGDGGYGGNSGFGGLNPAGDQWSAPIRPDHIPDYPTGSSVPFGPYGSEGNYPPSGGYPPSTPYRAGPVPGFAPPPPAGQRQGLTSPQQQRRRGVIILIASLAVLLVGTLTALLFLRPNDSKGGNGGPGIAIASDTPVPTATLKPGETPLPTRVPTTPPATPVPGAPPPTAIPYANSATVNFTAASKSITSGKQTFVAATSGGDIPATQKTASVNVGDTQTSGISATETGFGSQDSGEITVQNNTGFDQNAPQGIVVASQTQDGSGNTITCFTSDDSNTIHPVPSGGTTKQLCTVSAPARTVPTSTYSITISNWKYTGSISGGGAPPVFQVLSTCASANINAAHTAAQNSLAGKLGLGGGVTIFSNPAYSFSDSGAVCTPAVGTTQNNPFAFTVSVAGSGSETYYNNSDVQSFEAQQLQNAANNVAPVGNYQLLSSHNSICSGGGSTSNATSTSVTVNCPATGLAGWIWSPTSAHSTFDNLITGQPQGTAVTVVKSIQGVNAGTVSISLAGGSFVPQSGSAISYNIKTP